MKKKIDNDTLFRMYNKTKDKKIRDEIYFQNENLVYHFLSSLKTLENYEDILQEGRMGLLQAIENYNIEENIQFSTFAAHYIKGYAKRCHSTTCAVYIPSNLKWKYKKYISAKENNVNLTVQEIREKTGLDDKDILYFEQIGNIFSIVSLDKPIEYSGEFVNIMDILPDESIDIPYDFLINDINKEIIGIIYETYYGFTEKQFEILFFRLGINNHPKLKEREIPNIVGVDAKLVRSTIATYIRRQRDFKRNIRRRFLIPPYIKDIDVVPFIYKR